MKTIPLEHDTDRETGPGIVRVVHVVPAIHVINVDVVRVVPVCRPRFKESKPKAAVLKARISSDHFGLADDENVLAAKIGTEAIVWDPAVAADT